jgi:tetratricopeptide (TPR) repeat protein
MKKFNSCINVSKLAKKTWLVFFLLGLSACNDFLDELPDNRVTLDNFDKASQLLTNAYSVSSEAFTDWMTDNAGYTRGVAIRLVHEAAFEWGEFIDDPSEPDSPTFYWLESYNAIAHANEVLAVLDQIDATTEEEIKHKNAIESEARLTRAYAHFMLVNLFSKHYDDNNSLTDLGVPYVDTPETVFIKTYKRNTVRQVYDRVEEDLLIGLELTDDSFFANSGKYHFNRNAALAFASRFYLFKGEYSQCIDYSTEMLGNDPASFVRDLTSEEFQEAEGVFAYPQLYSSPELRSNLMLMRKISLVQRTDFGHGPTSAIYDELFGSNPFGAADARENPAFVKGENGLFPSRYENLFERSSLNSNVGTPYHIALAFRGEELLINRAEAYAQQNNLTQALADLQVLMTRRYFDVSTQLTISMLRNYFGVGSNPFVSDQAVVLEFILLEKRKEFLAQGLRWFDIKRYEIAVEHVLGDGATVELKERDKRKVIQLPTSAVEVGGLIPNP